MYTGCANKIIPDWGSVFSSDIWKSLLEKTGIELRLSGNQAYSSLSVWERLHRPLRRIVKNPEIDYEKGNPDLLLKIVIKSIKDNISENSLVSFKLLLEITPRLVITKRDLHNQQERMIILAKAQTTMSTIVAEWRILSALNRKIPRYADYKFKIGQKVLVYLEKRKHWIGPFSGNPRWWKKDCSTNNW